MQIPQYFKRWKSYIFLLICLIFMHYKNIIYLNLTLYIGVKGTNNIKQLFLLRFGQQCYIFFYSQWLISLITPQIGSLIIHSSSCILYKFSVSNTPNHAHQWIITVRTLYIRTYTTYYYAICRYLSLVFTYIDVITFRKF